MALDLCSINSPNAGAPACDANRGIPKYMVVTTKEFTSSEYASVTLFKAAFKTASLLPKSSSGKLIVLPVIANVESKKDANTEGSLNQGYKATLREGNPAFDFGVQISNRQAQVLRQLNGKDIQVFMVDDAKNVWGTALSNGNFRGEAAKIYITGDDFGDGQAVKTITISLSYTNASEYYDFSAYFPIDFNVSDYGKLKDVQIVEKAAQATNVFKLGGKIQTGRVGQTLDIYTDYSTPLASSSNWVVTNLTTNATIAITSVAVDAANSGWTVTVDSTAWTALTVGTKVSINFAAPSVLDAANVTGIEGTAIIYTK